MAKTEKPKIPTPPSYRIERLIAIKCNNLKMFKAKWKPFQNSKL